MIKAIKRQLHAARYFKEHAAVRRLEFLLALAQVKQAKKKLPKR